MTVITPDLEAMQILRGQVTDAATKLVENQIQTRLNEIQRLFPDNSVSFLCDMGSTSVSFRDKMQFGDDDNPLIVQYIFDWPELDVIAANPSVSLKRLAVLVEEIFELTEWLWGEFRNWPNSLVAAA